jgi:hypothetical protein
MASVPSPCRRARAMQGRVKKKSPRWLSPLRAIKSRSPLLRGAQDQGRYSKFSNYTRESM